MNSFSTSFFRTCAQANLPVLSKEYCVELLAWLYVYGGGYEAVVHNELMKGHISFAQQLFNVNGSEVPDLYLFQNLKPLVKHAEHLRTSQQAPDWALHIVEKYNIKGFPYEKVPEIPQTQQLSLF